MDDKEHNNSNTESLSTGLKHLNLKHVYRTGEDDLYSDFYKKVLSKAIRYDRAVGYFSSEILAANLNGLGSLISSNGKGCRAFGDSQNYY